MTLTALYDNWPIARHCLERSFPNYSFPATPPAEADLNLALTGLAVAHDLTEAELIEQILDQMLFTPIPEDGDQAAA